VPDGNIPTFADGGVLPVCARHIVAVTGSPLRPGVTASRDRTSRSLQNHTVTYLLADSKKQQAIVTTSPLHQLKLSHIHQINAYN
jgi:hypothetical protein